MISLADARQVISGLPVTGRTQLLALEAAAGRVLASPVAARVPSPPFTNSAMDGFAFRHADVDGEPIPIVGSIHAGAAGAKLGRELLAGRAAVRIMTGAALPRWADTVVPVEQAVVLDQGRERPALQLAKVPAKGAHVRQWGEDLKIGDHALAAGSRLTPERIMALAGLGIATVPVLAQPVLAVISTGDELCRPGESLGEGQIYNSTLPFLVAAARELCLPVIASVAVADDRVRAREQIEPILAGAEDPLVLLSTGAVSMGERDFVPDLARELGFEILFHKVAIRPGKPVMLARLRLVEGRQVYWLGLPGNQISTAVCWHVFARPLLARIGGWPALPLEEFRLTEAADKPMGLACVVRAVAAPEHGPQAQRILGSQGSAALKSSLSATTYLELPAGVDHLPAGHPVVGWRI